MKNHVTLIGTLGKDPEVKNFKGGRLCRLSVQTTESYKDKQGEHKEKSQWHNVTVWKDKLIEELEDLAKGALVAIEGDINYNKVENGKGTGYFANIQAKNVLHLAN